VTAPTADAPTRTLSVTPSGVLGTLAVLVVAAVCVRLGFWQLDRLDQRRQRNAALQARSVQEVIALATAPLDTAGLIYRRVRVSGGLDHDRSIVLAGRSLGGAPGVHLLAPLRFPDGSAVLVNRGWVASPDAASIALDSLAPAGPIAADGLVLPLPGAQGLDSGRDDAGGDAAAPAFQRTWFRMDPVALRRQFPYPIAEVEVRLLPDGAEAARPQRLPPPAIDDGPHLGYAIQWFSFAAIALIGWGAMVVRRDTRRRTTPRD
jgi:surfeit locus 1 family protein